jgi:hypothetical protein
MVQATIEEILARRSTVRRTLCEVLREIHDIGMDMGNGEITRRAEEALLKAKKMDTRLKRYKEVTKEHGIHV